MAIASSVPAASVPASESSSPVGVTRPLVPRSLLAAPPSQRDWTLTDHEREEVSRSITKTWTEQAIKCYMTGADCANCDIPRGNYSFQCQMDKVVPVLLESLGEPDPTRVRRLMSRHPALFHALNDEFLRDD